MLHLLLKLSTHRLSTRTLSTHALSTHTLSTHRLRLSSLHLRKLQLMLRECAMLRGSPHPLLPPIPKWGPLAMLGKAPYSCLQ